MNAVPDPKEIESVRLKVDSIAEAICEIRFSCEESQHIPELVVGKLVSRTEWSDLDKIRLPINDVPASVRVQDKNLKFQPTIEMRKAGDDRLVKLGDHVLSVHRLAPYPGGELFSGEVSETFGFLFASFTNFRIERLGLRYINLFTEHEHGVKSVGDLNQSVTVSGSELTAPLNLNYYKKHGDIHTALVRIATPEFVSGPGMKPFKALVDIDVFTPEGFECAEPKAATEWLQQARLNLKQEFFALFTQDLKDRLWEVKS